MGFYPNLQVERHPRDEAHVRDGLGLPREARIVPEPGVPPFRIGEIEHIQKSFPTVEPVPQGQVDIHTLGIEPVECLGNLMIE